MTVGGERCRAAAVANISNVEASSSSCSSSFLFVMVGEMWCRMLCDAELVLQGLAARHVTCIRWSRCECTRKAVGERRVGPNFGSFPLFDFSQNIRFRDLRGMMAKSL